MLIPFPWNDLPADILLDSSFTFFTIFPVKNQCPQSLAIALFLLTSLLSPFSHFIFLDSLYCCVSYCLILPPEYTFEHRYFFFIPHQYLEHLEHCMTSSRHPTTVGGGEEGSSSLPPSPSIVAFTGDIL